MAKNFVQEVVDPIRKLAGHTVDIPAIVVGAVLPFVHVADRVQHAYSKYLFDDATVADLPVESVGSPRFVINAASVQTGALFRFSQPYVADWRIGVNRSAPAKIKLALAVAASSAFPPVLSPAVIELEAGGFEAGPASDLCTEPFTTRIVLTDGGTYDNLGLETVYKRYQTVLVSDAGAALDVEEKPHQDWLRHGVRATEMLLNQTVALRNRQLIAAFYANERSGTYWSVRSQLASYQLPDAWPFDQELANRLAMTPTRLEALDDDVQTGLINWGYVVCDTAIRKHLDATKSRPVNLPYGQ